MASKTVRGEEGGIVFSQAVYQVYFCCAHYIQGLENFNQQEYIMHSDSIHNNVPKICCIILLLYLLYYLVYQGRKGGRERERGKI